MVYTGQAIAVNTQPLSALPQTWVGSEHFAKSGRDMDIVALSQCPILSFSLPPQGQENIYKNYFSQVTEKAKISYQQFRVWFIGYGRTRGRDCAAAAAHC